MRPEERPETAEGGKPNPTTHEQLNRAPYPPSADDHRRQGLQV